MRVLTWNVLHRVHAEKYGEPAIRTWPEERRRVEAIVALLGRREFDVALLQEVSGDVLAALRAEFGDREVLSHRYPRVPRVKQPSATVSDASEHLVVIAPRGATVLRAQTFANDGGKGLLAVSVDARLTVVSTHVSWGGKGVEQVQGLSALLRETTGPLCIGGDFNAERQPVLEQLGEGCVAAVLPAGSLRTREGDEGGSDIDHFFVRDLRISDVQVLEHAGLSDHRPVVITLG
jgi:endonuclease/exonuclease/phosphatase family metal-dependent hydrolase